jgi:hypothetical protein
VARAAACTLCIGPLSIALYGHVHDQLNPRATPVPQSNTFLAMSFFYGPIQRNANSGFFDHRVIDGFAINRLLTATKVAS